MSRQPRRLPGWWRRTCRWPTRSPTWPPAAIGFGGLGRLEIARDLRQRPVPTLAQLHHLGLELVNARRARRGFLLPAGAMMNIDVPGLRTAVGRLTSRELRRQLTRELRRRLRLSTSARPFRGQAGGPSGGLGD